MKLMATTLTASTVLALMAGTVFAASLDRAGTWTSSATYDANATRSVENLINDGSFEQGPPPASAWTENSNSPTCEWIGDWAGAWYLSGWHGFFDYWAGGYCYDDFGVPFAVTSSVSQTLHIAPEFAAISFYYASYRPDGDDAPLDDDHVYVAVDGVELWTMPMTTENDTYPEWVGPVVVDLTTYAGQDVQLTFGGVSEGDFTGNVRFDYINWEPTEPTPVMPTTWGSIKATYR